MKIPTLIQFVYTVWGGEVGVGMETRQLTEDNADFSSRHRYHQSSFIQANGMVRP